MSLRLAKRWRSACFHAATTPCPALTEYACFGPGQKGSGGQRQEGGGPCSGALRPHTQARSVPHHTSTRRSAPHIRALVSGFAALGCPLSIDADARTSRSSFFRHLCSSRPSRGWQEPEPAVEETPEAVEEKRQVLAKGLRCCLMLSLDGA
eukprot:169549-Rhodomonas_salina.2